MKRLIEGMLILSILWFVASSWKITDPFFMPNPIDVLEGGFHLIQSGQLINDSIASLFRIVLAFTISMVVGVPSGLVLGRAPSIYRRLEFIIDFFRSTPATALFPLFMVVFGVSDTPKIVAASFGGFLIILFNTAYGVMHSQKMRLQAISLMGASQAQKLRYITVYESLPQTFIGLRGAVSLCVMVIIVTEMFLGTDAGLGRRIIDSQTVFDVKGMYACIIAVGILGYLLNMGLLMASKRFIHWIAE